MTLTQRLLILALIVPAAASAADQTLNPAATARYQAATAKIQARAFGEAITGLNELAAEYPRVAEIFAARCSAQVGQRAFPGAEADCTYALAVKPTLSSALYGLAMAQEGLGKRDAAVASYRRYAALDPSVAPSRDQALARATALGGSALEPATGKLIVYRNHRFAGPGRLTLVLDNHLVGDISMNQFVEIETTPGEHMLEARAPQTNVYDVPKVWTLPVQLGSGSVYANFDTSGGMIVFQAVPTQQGLSEIRDDECVKAYGRHISADSPPAPPVAVAQPPQMFIAAAPPPECRMGADGRQACGYNCRIGANGVAACADTPNGVCAIGANGRVTCSHLGGGAAMVGGPPPECRMSSRGVNTCGYNCRHGSDGEVYCSSHPNGQCALNSDGSWSCP